MGSLFDGIGGFIYAGNKVGIKTVWSSEIDPCCEAVTKHHFPQVKQLGDITKINGAKVEPVDIICGGSPCQDLSVAGKRAGLAGERSGLYMEQIRIIREMREATNNTYPRYMVWENVPGALSSNKGEDFRAVIEEAARCAEDGISIPEPKRDKMGKIKWSTAGNIVGNGWSIAWRILDAQYWGVPQRRRRIFLVADFGSECSGEILFKQEGLRGNSAESRKTWEGTSEDVTRSVDGSAFNESGIGYWMRGFGCLRVGGDLPVVCQKPSLEAAGFNGWKSVTGTIQYEEDRCPTIEANMPPNVLCVDCRNHCINDVSATIQAKENGGQTLNYINPVCYPIDQHQQDARFKLCDNGIVPTMSAKMGTGGNNTPMILCSQDDNKGCWWDGGQISQTIDAVVYKGQTMPEKNRFPAVLQSDPSRTRRYIIRRLTPTECERLQGYSDGWTDITFKGKKMSDSARYRMEGNSVAIPCVIRVLGGIVNQMRLW